MRSSLCRSFKSIALKWIILGLARSYIYCPPGVQIGVEQQTSLLSDIHCFSYIHDVLEYYCYIPANQIILGCKIYFSRLVTHTKKIFPPILIGTVFHAFLHNDGCNNDEMGLMKYISKALNTSIYIFLNDVAAANEEKPFPHS